jgi:hypothetical protein
VSWRARHWGGRAAALALLAAALAWLAAMKTGRVPVRPGSFALLVGALLLTVGAVLALAVRRSLPAGPGRPFAVAEALAAAGLLLVGGGGLANWLLGYQGFVVVLEREPVRLSRAEQLNAFEAGPLGRLHDLDLTIGLARLALTSNGPGQFSARSRLKVLDASGVERAVELAPGAAARIGSLVLRQGAFGFCPRITVTVDGKTVHDGLVFFRTLREGPDGLAFVGELDLAGPKLRLDGVVTLENLDGEMRGHPSLQLTVRRDGGPVRAVGLQPGKATEVVPGVVVSFTGLRRWAEIDFSRRTYALPIWLGLGMLGASALLGTLALVRARRGGSASRGPSAPLPPRDPGLG